MFNFHFFATNTKQGYKELISKPAQSISVRGNCVRALVTALIISSAVLSGSLFLSTRVHAALLPAPGNLAVTVEAMNQFRISWSPVPGASGYLVKRRTNAERDWATIATLGAGATFFHSNVQNGSLNSYRVQAFSATAAGQTVDSAPIPMLWPTGLSLLPLAADRIQVSWTLPENIWVPSSAYSTIIERRLPNGDWILAGRAEPGALSFTDTGLPEGARVEYRARFDLGLSGAALWWPPGGMAGWSKLLPPSGLTARLTPFHTIELSWTTGSAVAQGTRIERSTDGAPFVLLTSLPAGTLSFTDSNAVNGRLYRYRLRHTAAATASDNSQEARILFLHPQTLSVEAAFPDQVNLVWTWPSTDPALLSEARPRIERRGAGDASWVLAALLEPGVTEYRDRGLDSDTLYSYRIQAQYPDGSLSPLYPPQAQGREVRTGITYDVAFSGHALSGTMVRLEWDFEALEGRAVRLERFDALDIPRLRLQTASEGSFTETELLPGIDYTWQLVILSPSGKSVAVSPPLTAKTELAPAPQNVRAMPASVDRVIISWDYAYGLESGFEVWRRTAGTWVPVGETLRNVQTWTDTALPEAGKAQWKVRAVRGETVFSAFTLTQARRLDIPALPQTFEGSLNLGRLRLSWPVPLQNLGADAAYNIETRAGINEAWVSVVSVPAGSTSFEWFNLHHGPREFRIRADIQGLPLYSASWFFSGAATATPRATPGAIAVPSPAPSPSAVRFTDLGGHRWAAPSIERLAALGIVSGTSATRFSPGQALTRAEFIKMLFGVQGIAKDSRPIGPVADVPRTAWHAAWMYAAWNSGVLMPDLSGRLFPNTAITRGEMALAIWNAALYSGKGLLPATEASSLALASFSDSAAIQEKHREALSVMLANGILRGQPGAMLAPNTGLTRAEAAVVMQRLLALN